MPEKLYDDVQEVLDRIYEQTVSEVEPDDLLETIRAYIQK